jgi:hypothetical protein|nr:MAG TPA: protein of unknown function (DUF4969) [Caudoviricetes sp.]
MSKKKLAIYAVGIIITALCLTACTDALIGSVTRFNNKADITCYSGSATPVFTDRSTGKVKYSEHGGGVYYKSSKTGKFVQLYMDCVITEVD